MSSLYDDLGVEKGASEEEIKKAHRKKVKASHPDAGGDPEDFHKIQRAYLVLMDAERRQKYDETGNVDDAPKGNSEHQLKEMLRTIVLKLIRSSDINIARFTDIRKLLLQDLDETAARLTESMTDMRSGLLKIETILKRLHRKKGKAGEDQRAGYLKEAFQHFYDLTVKEVAQAQEVLDQTIQMRAIVEANGYTMDEQPHGSHQFQYGMGVPNLGGGFATGGTWTRR